MSLIRKHVAVLQAWACLDLVDLGLGFHVHTRHDCMLPGNIVKDFLRASLITGLQ